ncbi:MAG: hypothetical protein V4757_11245 [Pseudomonadota bacterium]
MKSRVMRCLALCLAVVSLVGCASARLEIESAIYREEPVLSSRLNQESLLRLRAAIDSADTRAKALRDARHALAKTTVEALYNYRCLIYKARSARYVCTPQQLVGDLGVSEYLGKVDEQLDLVRNATGRVRAAIIEYDQIAAGDRKAPPPVERVVAGRDKVMEAINLLAARLLPMGPAGFGTDYEGDVKETLAGARGALDPATLTALSSGQANPSLQAEARKLAGSLDALANELSRQEREGLRAASKTSDELKRAAQSMRAAGPGFAASVQAGVAGMAKINDDYRLDSGSVVIAGLAETLDFYNSQIDRLQDPADPVWREVVDPRNDAKWNPVFARTVFYSEGNTGVVVVRDRAGEFRVHQAKNNPTALIQGQLRISRAVTSGLTDVLGAMTGASGLKGVLPAGKSDAADGDTAAVESIAEGDAKVRAETDRRRALRANLLRNLERINSQLQGMEEDDDRLDGLKAELQGILDGHKALFAKKPGGTP